MFQYKINLPFKIENCTGCPFRTEKMMFESVESQDKLTGIICIQRRTSHCNLKGETIFNNESADGYNSKCPLKGNVTQLVSDN